MLCIRSFKFNRTGRYNASYNSYKCTNVKPSTLGIGRENPYYEYLEGAMKICKYVNQRNVTQLPKSVQDIIRDQQNESGKSKLTAADVLKKAVAYCPACRWSSWQHWRG